MLRVFLNLINDKQNIAYNLLETWLNDWTKKYKGKVGKRLVIYLQIGDKNMQTIHTQTGTGNEGGLPIHVQVDNGVDFSSLLLPAVIAVAIIIIIILIILVIREYNLQKKKKKNA
jgi:hypothetical protein